VKEPSEPKELKEPSEPKEPKEDETSEAETLDSTNPGLAEWVRKHSNAGVSRGERKVDKD
jgi:hypothetical protein